MDDKDRRDQRWLGTMKWPSLYGYLAHLCVHCRIGYAMVHERHRTSDMSKQPCIRYTWIVSFGRLASHIRSFESMTDFWPLPIYRCIYIFGCVRRPYQMVSRWYCAAQLLGIVHWSMAEERRRVKTASDRTQMTRKCRSRGEVAGKKSKIT